MEPETKQVPAGYLVSPIHRATDRPIGRVSGDEPGVRQQIAASAVPLSEKGQELFHASANPRDNLCTTEGTESSTLLTWSKAVRAVTISAILAIGGLALIIITSEIVQLLAAIQLLPTALRVMGFVALAAAALLVALSIYRFLTAYFKLRLNRQVTAANVQSLNELHRLRRSAARPEMEAVDLLRNYLAEYPCGDEKHLAFLKSCKLSEEQIEDFVRESRHLQKSAEAVPAQWVNDFRDKCQNPLDQAALGIIKNYSRRIGLKSALSPNPLLDTVIVIYGGFSMLTDLCRVYDVRVGPLQTLKLAALVASHSYLAGRIEDISDSAEDFLTEKMDAVIRGACSELSGVLAIATVGVGARTAQALTNGLIIFKLGRHAQKLLRPVEL